MSLARGQRGCICTLSWRMIGAATEAEAWRNVVDSVERLIESAARAQRWREVATPACANQGLAVDGQRVRCPFGDVAAEVENVARARARGALSAGATDPRSVQSVLEAVAGMSRERHRIRTVRPRWDPKGVGFACDEPLVCAAQPHGLASGVE